MATPAIAQETYLHCDFERGIPKSFATYDRDGNEPSVDAKTYGFSKGKAWVAYYISSEKNRVASSTSWYTPSGTSNDWLVTSPFVVKSANARLRWNAAAADKKYRDGYSVYISTTGNRPENFTSDPILKVSAENKDWTRHEVSLAQYKGKKIWVAFVNDSYNKSRLFLDEIFAGVPSSIYLLSGLDYIIPYDGKAVVNGQAYTEDTDTIRGFTVGLDVDGERYVQSFPDSVIIPGSQTPFTLNQPITVEDGITKEYTLWITNGVDTFSLARTVTPYVQRVVAEESTGTWCSWCVRGIVNMAKMRNLYPTSFIGIAVHNADPMQNSYYDTQINGINSGGYPKVIINRDASIKGDPGELDVYYNKALLNPSYSSVSVSAENNGKHLSIHSSLTFADSTDADLRFAYVIIENNVHQPDSAKYGQYNAAYSNGQLGEMGGFEKYGDLVPASEMWHQEVARCMVDNKFDGVDGSLPSSFEAEVPVSFDYMADISNVTIFNDSETEIIALVLNADGKIVNAAKSKIKQTSGIQDITTNSKNQTRNLKMYNLQGQQVGDSYRGIVICNGKKIIK